MIHELFEQMEKEEKDTILHADKNEIIVQGYPACMLSFLTQIIKSMSECEGIERKDIERVVDLAYMSDKELKKTALEKMRNMLKKATEELEKEEENE